METQLKYISNGTTKEFIFNFKIFKADNLEVYLNNILQESGYIAELNSTGGTVIFNDFPISKSEVLIKRNLKTERLNDYQEAGTISSSDLNLDFDYITELLKQTNEMLKYKLGSSTENLKLPTGKSGYGLIWSEDEKELINSKINLLTEVLKAEKASSDAELFLSQMQSLLSHSGDGSAYGLILNLMNLLSEKFPELSSDFGNIMSDYTESQDNGCV